MAEGGEAGGEEGQGEAPGLVAAEDRVHVQAGGQCIPCISQRQEDPVQMSLLSIRMPEAS